MMSPVSNYFFSEINKGVVGKIFLETRALSSLASVSKFFHEVVKEQANRVYEELKTVFTEGVIEHLLIEKKGNQCSCLAKVDILFQTVHKTQNALNFRPYDPDLLNQALQMRSLVKLWEGLLEQLKKEGSSSLKTEIEKVVFPSGLWEQAESIRLFFKVHASKIKWVSRLHLQGMGLIFVPKEIALFSGLSLLDLSANLLRALPLEVFQLSYLKDLNVSQNMLPVISEEIEKLSRLQTLEWANNGLETFPVAIDRLKQLAILNLSGNHLKELPHDLKKFSLLLYLYVENNELTFIPQSMGDLSYLIGLYLSNNQIAFLPPTIGRMNRLQYLSLGNNCLKDLPEEIGNLKSLSVLSLDHNQIQELPISIGNLTQLERFSIAGNDVSILPVSMQSLMQLKYFCWAENPLVSIDPALTTLPFWSLNPSFYPRAEMFRLANPPLNNGITPAQFFSVYRRLGDNKWKEGIDGKDHHLGPEVYDKGLHGGTVEVGFLSGLQRGYQFLEERCNRKVDVSFYLGLHQEICSHFRGKQNNTLLEQKELGRFRNRGVTAPFASQMFTSQGLQEYDDLNRILKLHLGSSFQLGRLGIEGLKVVRMYYHPLKEDQVKLIFNYFLTEFYYEIGHTTHPNQQKRAIAKLIRNWEWLHPPRDGCGRTDTAMLNYLLTCYGFTPVLLKHPYISSTVQLELWVEAINKGMIDWERGTIN